MNMTSKARSYLSAAMCFCLLCVVPAVAETSTAYWAPWVTKTTTNSAVINWRGANNGTGSIEYAASSYYNEHHRFEKSAAAPAMTNYQHVLLAGLEPNTSYIYRVKPSGNEDVFGNRAFRTMPVSGPFTFIVISDSQEGHNYTERQRFKYVADAIAKETNALFILHGGDYAGHDSKDLWTTFSEVADGMLAKTAIFPAIGNHEYHNGGTTNGPTPADQYHWAFDTDMDAPLNYSFDCSGIRFVVLDSPDPNNANGDDPQTSPALARSQAPWLREQLDNAMAGTFTIHHHPIWDNGRTDINSDLESWENLYHAYKISATFAGHTHNYQRFLVKGTPYFIVGIAGGRCSDLTGPAAVWYQFGETRKLGYLKVSVDPENNTATAREIVVASVQENDSDEIPRVYDPPLIDDAVTFPLKKADIRNDFDGDGKSDPALYHPVSGLWGVLFSSRNYTLGTAVFGGSGLPPLSADFDGDGLADPSVYDAPAAALYARLSNNGYALAEATGFGGLGFESVNADLDGDGKADPAVYCEESGTWLYRRSTQNYMPEGLTGFGGVGYVPAPGDYDGDRKADLAIYQEESGSWFVRAANGEVSYVWLGGPDYQPVYGDYDGDAHADPAVYRESDGSWLVKMSKSGTIRGAASGGPGMAPVPGDYDGDGKADPAWYRGSDGLWGVCPSSMGYIPQTMIWGGGDYAPPLKASVHDNIVTFWVADPDLGPIAYNNDAGYYITGGQPWQGVSVDNESVSCTLDAKAGRKGSTSPAQWFKNRASVALTTGDFGDGWPKNLNFAFNGTLTIGGSDSYQVVVGQGSDGFHNNWWVGGVGFTFNSNDTVIITPDRKYNIIPYTGGRGGVGFVVQLQ
ncbi:MAG: metallophosphoesterase [Kiritimatiellia bacterium]